MTHAEAILRAAGAIAGDDLAARFSRNDVREYLGLTPEDWLYGYTAIFQGMRDDHPPGAPPVGERFEAVFHRVSHGQYILNARGRVLVASF